jgi:predicted dehydrogenase/nucleoside-diphosphate-sugar epimerase
MSQRQFRIGFIGTGYIADWHAKAVAALPYAQLSAVFDSSKVRAKSFAEKYNTTCYDSLQTMFSKAALDAVHVLVPPDYHRSIAEQALDAGLGVLIEKPICATVEEARAIAAAADRAERPVGVSHNSLFWRIFERAKKDIDSGRLGRIEQLDIVWNVELGQIKRGPFNIWMLRHPHNMLLEVGPHPIGLLLALAGYPDEIACSVYQPAELHGGKVAYRRWEIDAQVGGTSAHVSICVGPCFTEQRLFIRGILGTAVVDFTRNTYTLLRNTRFGPDFDRFFSLCGEGKALIAQASGTIARYGLSKFKLSKEGNPYGASILRTADCFYRNFDGVQDERLSPSFGCSVVELCARMAQEAIPDSNVQQPVKVRDTVTAAASDSAANGGRERRVLVFGGTGFIGKQLVKKLLLSGERVRLFTRQSGPLPDDFSHPNLEVFSGSMLNAGDVERALDGVKHVYHLARAEVKSRSEYMQLDIEPTRVLGELSVRHGIERLIYTGTIDSYYAGARAGRVTEQTPLDPSINRRNNYAWAKAQAERCLIKLHRDQKLPLVIMRPGIVIGSGGSPFHWGVGMWFGYSICQTWGRGGNKLPFVLVEDVADGLLAALDAPGIEGESFNLIDKPYLTAEEYCRELEKSLGMAIENSPTSIWRFYATDMAKWVIKCLVRHPERRMPSYRDWESRTQKAFFDCTRTAEKLGWNLPEDRERLIRLGIQVPAMEFLA